MKKKCLQCLETFEAKRKDKRFCTTACRQAYHSERYAMLKGTMPKEFERVKLQTRKERIKVLGKLYKEVPGDKCVYCGLPAQCKDHLMPISVADVLYINCLVNKIPMPQMLLVPACNRCNLSVGAKAFGTFEDKRSFILDKIIEKGETYDPEYIPPIRSKQLVMAGELETCAICETNFVAARGGQKFCSDDCMNVYRKAHNNDLQ